MGNKVKLGELLSTLTDYHANGAYKKLKENVELLDAPDFAVMIRTTNFEQEDFSNNVKYISKLAYEFLAKSKVHPNDIIMNKIANAGSSYLMPDLQVPVSLAMNLFLLRVDDTKANPIYVYIYLKINEAYVKSFANGSVTKTITKDAVRNLEIELPSRAIQDRIVDQFTCINDKIILNRQINQTLEQMAQVLFKSWFVDFDPVVDNALDAGFFEQDLEFSDELLRRAEARKAVRECSDFKPLSNDIRQLFPAAFEECVEPSLGLEGWIPKGWQAGELGDVLLLRNERIKPSSETKRIPYVPIECIGTKEPLLSESKSGEEANSSLILFKEGDILFGAMRPYFHKVCIAPFNGVTRSTVFTLTAKDSESLYFSFFQAYQESTVKYATLHCEGSTIPYAKWKGSLDRKPIVLPTKEVQHLFHQRVKSFIEWGNSSNEQSQSLLKVRDTLLPKLISGELHLDEIET